jgi:hypothetical protein
MSRTKVFERWMIGKGVFINESDRHHAYCTWLVVL